MRTARPVRGALQPVARVLLAGIVVGLVTTSCGGGHQTESTNADDSGTWEDLPLVGQSYRSSAAEVVAQLDGDAEALDLAMESCMHQKGFLEFDQQTESSKSLVLELMARAPTEDVARSRGLNVVETLRLMDQRTASAPESEMSQSESGTAMPPVDMATAEAASVACKESNGSTMEERLGRLRSVVSKYTAQVLSDDRIARARTDWSTCMGRAGYDVDTVSELRGMFALDYDQVMARLAMAAAEKEEANSDLLAKEVDAALAQVECDHEVYWPILGHWKELEDRFQDENAFEIRGLDRQSRTFFGAYVDL